MQPLKSISRVPVQATLDLPVHLVPAGPQARVRYFTQSEPQFSPIMALQCGYYKPYSTEQETGAQPVPLHEEQNKVNCWSTASTWKSVEVKSLLEPHGMDFNPTSAPE